jgi:Phytanoyl-CoA dioxygenase (PhyH)
MNQKVCIRKLVNGYEFLDEAINWISEKASFPHKDLEPQFDVKTGRVSKLRKLYWHAPFFWENWINKTGLTALVKEFFEDPVLIKHAVFLKDVKDSGFVPLHQDIALWEKKYFSAKTFWVSLTASSRINGGLFYLAECSQLYEHELDINYPQFKIIDLDRSNLSEDDLVEVKTLPGEVVIWEADVPHGSYINKNGELRLGMPFVFIERSEYIGVY